MSLEEARDHLDLAREQWERAATASWEPAEPASCVTNVFYAYENLIVAVAEAKGLAWAPNHYRKAELAKKLHDDGILKRDVGDDLLRFNDLRKDVSYGEPGPELHSADLEDIVSNLESFLEEIEELVTGLEAESEESEE